VKTSACVLFLVLGSSGIAFSEEESCPPEPPVDPQGPITRIDGDSPSQLAGSNVHLDDIPIRGKSGNGMWVGHGERRIFIAPIDPSALEFLTVGTRVDIHGTAREAPNAAQARKVYAVDRSTARRLGGVYL
jgi:hypothetical protein